MPKTPVGKTRGNWYVDSAVVKALKIRCAEEDKRESHVVEEALRVMLDIPSVKQPA